MPAPSFTDLEISSLSASDIEYYLPRDSSKFDRFSSEPLDENECRLIRRWLILNNMVPRKVHGASQTVLRNAYRAGKPYIDKVNEEDMGKRFGTSSRRGPRVSIDYDADTPTPKTSFSEADKKAAALLGRMMDSDASAPTPEIISEPEPERSEVVPKPTPDPSPAPAARDIKIDEAAIARAAAAVIQPRLESAKRDLMKLAADEIQKAAAAFAISDSTKAEIHSLASSAGEAAADKLLKDFVSTANAAIADIKALVPRPIEIKIDGREPRLLKAEPRHKIFEEVLETLISGEHVYLVGPAGTGKTHMFKQLADALDQPVTILGQTLTKYEFSGFMSPTGEYVGTLLRTAVEEGHLLCIDEIDMSAAAAIGFLNSLTANNYVAFPDKMVDAHPRFRVVAAANTYGHGATTAYIGRNPLDAASLDRFSYIECGYDEDLERLLYGDTPWTQYVHRVRKAVEQLGQQHVVSGRAILRGKRRLAAGADAARVCEVALWRGLPRDTVSKIIQIAGEFKPVERIAA